MKNLLPVLLLTAASCQASLCDSGQRQSPIAITPESLASPSLPAMQLHYLSAPLRLANDGHTVRVRFAKAGQITLGDEPFRLEQVHFHTPGGDQINGEHFPMAAHLLHRDRQGRLLAITLAFRLGAENPVLKALLPQIPIKADGDHLHPQLPINVAALMPADLGYYRYSGSLTEAPCTENVEWLVMKQPVELSPAQLAAYRQRFADNMRAPNPLHGRIVRQSP